MPEPKVFRHFIEQYTVLEAADWQVIEARMERKCFARNQVILEEGQICRHFYFLEEGMVRFYTNHDGVELTKSFVIPPYCFTSRASFRKQEACQEGIQALDQTVVWQISHDDYRKLESLLAWNVFMRKLLNEIQEYSDVRNLEQLTMTAEMRYLKILNSYPEALIRKIPLKHLSTYLGIAPQSLSRIRKKFQKSGAD